MMLHVLIIVMVALIKVSPQGRYQSSVLRHQFSVLKHQFQSLPSINSQLPILSSQSSVLRVSHQVASYHPQDHLTGVSFLSHTSYRYTEVGPGIQEMS